MQSLQRIPICESTFSESDIDNITCKENSKIVFLFRDEFDIIPVSESTNRSPVIHISHNVGIESWCVKTVFMYCYENTLKINPLWRREHVRLDRYTRMALLLNPNIATFWNARKNLILHQYLEAKSDFLLTKLVLGQKPKCVEALAHRRWLLQQSLGNPGWLESELKLCDQLSNRMKCNYHAWSHRQWVYNLANTLHGFDPNLWVSEFQTSEEWTKYHVSDHTGWHHRKFLLGHLKNSLTEARSNFEMIKTHFNDFMYHSTPSAFYASLLVDELRKNGALILCYSSHETLWYYRRFLLEAGQREPNVPYSWTEETSFLDKCYCQTNAKTICNAETSQRRVLDQHRLWLSRNWKH